MSRLPGCSQAGQTPSRETDGVKYQGTCQLLVTHWPDLNAAELVARPYGTMSEMDVRWKFTSPTYL